MYATIGGTPAIVTTVAAVIITVVVSRYYANKGKLTSVPRIGQLYMSKTSLFTAGYM